MDEKYIFCVCECQVIIHGEGKWTDFWASAALTYLPGKKTRGSPTILGSQAGQGSAVQCSGDSFLSPSVVADLFAHSTEMERRESKSSNIWLLIAADQKIDRSSNFGFDQ